MAAKQAATQRASIDSVFQLPGRDQFIADIGVNLPARGGDRLGEIIDEAVDQTVEGEGTQALSQARRALHIEEQEDARFQPRRIIAAGDEVEQHVLAEKDVHVDHEGEDERRGEREQHVYALNAPFSGRREHPLSEPESEQDDGEIDNGPDRHMRGKRRAAKRRSERPPQNEGVEGRQYAGDDRTGHRAAREAIDGQRVPAPLQDMHLRIGCA